GGSQTFNGYGDFIGMGSGALNPGLNNISLSAWIKRGDTGVRTTTLMAKSNGDSPCVDYGYVFAIDWENYVRFYLASDGASWGDAGSFALKSDVRFIDMSSWHHIFIAIDRSGNGNCKIYIDGEDRTGNTDGDIRNVGEIVNALPLRIGIEADASYPYQGSIDETVMAYTARSSDWVKLCYMNQKAVDALVEFK
ncbi:MAG: LamG domain-containing protein, partial [Chitinispirillaceae bacterium]|nr:LamG domain-containing protein [Chitinispirillaceae bacterium]